MGRPLNSWPNLVDHYKFTVPLQIANDLVPYPMQGQNSTSSSAMNGFGHSIISSVLDIEFTYGSVYRYDGVGNGTANGLKSATSKGAYFNENIRGQYPYVQIY